MSSILVAYFSPTGATARLAHGLAGVLGADLYEIKARPPYSVGDLNWQDKRSRSSLEMANPESRPEIAGGCANMAAYKTVFVGFPIWWHQAPRIIETFLEQYNFAGKSLVPFATSGGSPLGDTENILEKICPAANWLPGRRLNAVASEADLRAWTESLGIQFA